MLGLWAAGRAAGWASACDLRTGPTLIAYKAGTQRSQYLNKTLSDLREASRPDQRGQRAASHRGAHSGRDEGHGHRCLAARRCEGSDVNEHGYEGLRLASMYPVVQAPAQARRSNAAARWSEPVRRLALQPSAYGYVRRDCYKLQVDCDASSARAVKHVQKRDASLLLVRVKLERVRLTRVLARPPAVVSRPC